MFQHLAICGALFFSHTSAALLDTPALDLSDSDRRSHRRLQGIDLNGCNGLTVLAGSTTTCAGGQCDIFGGDMVVGTTMTGPFNFVDTITYTGDSSVCLASAVSAVATIQAGTSMPADIGGLTFSPGTYVHPSAVGIPAAKNVYLDAGGDPNAVFIFKMGSTLTTGAGVKIVLQNGAVPENVYWLLGTALTTGANNVLVGTIMAGSAMTIGTNTQICGDVIAQTAVTCGGTCYIGSGQEGCPISTPVVPSDPAPLDPGVNGDPLIMGFQGQLIPSRIVRKREFQVQLTFSSNSCTNNLTASGTQVVGNTLGSLVNDTSDEFTAGDVVIDPTEPPSDECDSNGSRRRLQRRRSTVLYFKVPVNCHNPPCENDLLPKQRASQPISVRLLSLIPSAVPTSLPSQPTSVKLLALEGGTESIEQNKGTTFSTTSKRRTSRHSQRKKHPRGLQKLRSSKSYAPGFNPSSYSSFIPSIQPVTAPSSIPSISPSLVQSAIPSMAPSSVISSSPTYVVIIYLNHNVSDVTEDDFLNKLSNETNLETEAFFEDIVDVEIEVVKVDLYY